MEKKFWITLAVVDLLLVVFVAGLFMPVSCKHTDNKAHIDVVQMFEHFDENEHSEYYFDETTDTPAALAITTSTKKFNAEMTSGVAHHDWACQTTFKTCYTFDFVENEDYTIIVTPPTGYTYTNNIIKFNSNEFKNKAYKGKTIVLSFSKIK